MTYIWLSPHNHNPIVIHKAIKQRLNDMFHQQWHSNISEMSSCTLYRMFKSECKLEKYLLNLNKPEQINLCKFRCRDTKLPVVVLGYSFQNIAYSDRLCTLCNLNEVGDEYHYIMKCSFFQNSRERYINNDIWRNPDYYKFSSLFKSNDMGILRNLARFVKIINLEMN